MHKYLIGIDVAKFKHTGCVISSNFEVLVEPLDFSNDSIGFNTFFTAIKPYLNDGLVGLEDTGHYGENLVSFLKDHSAKIAMFNPHTTNHIRLAANQAKNDRLDSLNIASSLIDPRNYRLAKNEIPNRLEIRQLTRMHHKRSEELNSYKVQLQKDIDHVFPEYNKLFKMTYSKTYMRILKDYQSADNIAHTDIRSLRKSIRPVGCGKSASIKAEDLKEAAKNSIGVKNLSIELDIKHICDIISDLNDILNEIDKKIEEFSIQLNPSILTMPGISHFSAMSIISEIGDIANFDDPKRLIKFAGVNPYVYESGTYSMPRTRIEKKGSKYLRKTLYEIINAVIRFNPTFQAYYDKKIKEGKTHRCAQGHCIRKLLRIIYHLLSTDTVFDASHLK